MITGQLTKTETGYEGFVASLAFDTEVVISPNEKKETEIQPDYIIFGRSPRGRQVRIGGGWMRRSEKDNDYLCMTMTVGRETVNANGVATEDELGKLTVIPWSD